MLQNVAEVDNDFIVTNLLFLRGREVIFFTFPEGGNSINFEKG